MAGISQEYVLRAGNPFQIQLVSQDSTWIALKYLFADRDRDGDQDLFEIGFTWDTSGFNTIFNMMYHIEYQENIGTQQQAMYAPQVEPFNNFSF